MGKQQKSSNVDFNLNTIIKRTRDARRKALRVVKVEMQKALQDALSTPYPPSSRPGQIPHMRTGNLRSRIRVVERGDGSALTVNMPDYGFYHETGIKYPTQKHSKKPRRIEKRPFFKPIILNRRRYWVNRINTEIRKAYER